METKRHSLNHNPPCTKLCSSPWWIVVRALCCVVLCGEGVLWGMCWLAGYSLPSSGSSINRQNKHVIHTKTKHRLRPVASIKLSARGGFDVAASPLYPANSSLQSTRRLVSPIEGCPAADCNGIVLSTCSYAPLLIWSPSGFHLPPRW